ncbi:hypothetical protein ACPUEN_09335 [Algoriphagus yeomjeoni]|uniref:hypothetical protein n=1 Tax=Algoriphagus yeomjeoni TaxID=291403 RepID=UPI003CE5C349
MKRSIFGLIVLVPILMSCAEDEEKVIQTDLPTEASQLFSISKDWNESLYFAMITWKEYQQVDSLNLPGCPAIHLDQVRKVVTLDFLAGSTCTQSGEYSRSGKLTIKFEDSLANSINQWTLTYDDYHFGSKKIEGIRTFTRNGSDEVLEEFNDLIESTETNLSTEFSGKFTHTKAYVNDSLVSFSSTGSLSGLNAVGREFEIAINAPVNRFINCLQENEVLPKVGAENWFVSRGGNSEVSYLTTYEVLVDECKVAANTMLPDGRKLLLNPKK